MKLTENEYFAAQENSEGYCEECDELTRLETEPDAEDYDCPKCGNNSVMGIENALINDKIDIIEIC